AERDERESFAPLRRLRRRRLGGRHRGRCRWAGAAARAVETATPGVDDRRRRAARAVEVPGAAVRGPVAVAGVPGPMPGAGVTGTRCGTGRRGPPGAA